MKGLLRGKDGPLRLVDDLELAGLPHGSTTRLAVRMIEDAVGLPVAIPVLIARGAHDGPVFGVTAAVHGNELNGIRVIQRLFSTLDIKALRGTLVGCPVVNVPAFEAGKRTFGECWDLNRIMPGRAHGHTGEVYAHRLMERILCHFDYLIDLHTASLGRINSLYARANLEHEVAAKMAALVGPEIVVHSPALDGTVRGACMARGIASITLEVGNPMRFESRLVKDSLTGVRNVLSHFDMLPESEVEPDEPVVCMRSYWIYSQHGGLLDVFPDLVDHVKAGQRIARVTSLFGDIIAEYRAPEDGVVVGRSTNPICDTGSRILHLGAQSH